MNIYECLNFLNFWINKELGTYYTPSELVEILDRGQMSLFSDYQPKYATSQRIKDTLSPFRDTYAFTGADTTSGVITIPSNKNFLNLLDVRISYGLSARTLYYSVPMVNEDELSARLNSQVDPVTVTSPVGEVKGKGVIQLWPQTTYSGTATFLRRPVKPVFAYTVISGRVLVYDSSGSTQLEWKEDNINEVLVKALVSVGINLGDGAMNEWAQVKSTQNFQNINKI